MSVELRDAYRNITFYDNTNTNLGTATAKAVDAALQIKAGFGISLTVDTSNNKVTITNTGPGAGALTTVVDNNTNNTFYPIFTRAPAPGDINPSTGTYQMDTMYLDQTTTPMTYNPGTATLTVVNISAPTITGHPTVEGVTSTGATGTGKFVFDTTPTISNATLSGHPTVEGVTSTGATGTGKFVFDTSPTIVTPSVTTNLTTTSTSFDLLNVTPTTINFAGNTNVLSIGSSTGASTINNSLAVTGSSSFTLSGVAITGTTGQFSCTATSIKVNDSVTLSGTFGGTGSITGYSNPTTYYVVETNGTTTFTLSNLQQAIIGALSSSTTYTSLTGTKANIPNTFNSVSQTSTSGSGVGATFAVSTSGVGNTNYSGFTTITLLNPGSGYALGDTITIAGASLGGTTPTNNLTFTLSTALLGNIVTTAGTPTGLTYTVSRGAFVLDSANMTTTKSTINVFNNFAKTINFGGAATAVNIGASGSTVTFTNSVTVSNNLMATSISVNNTSPSISGGSPGGTGYLFDSNVTTGRLFGNATTIQIGSNTAGGTLTIQNPIITGSTATTFNMNGSNPSIVTSNTGTASVFNTNATTGNLFGAASTVSIGSGSGTTTINNALSVWGVTSTGATGTGKFVFDTSPTISTPSISSPTITGHPTIEGVTSTGATGTGNIVFSSSPTLTGTMTVSNLTVTGTLTSSSGVTSSQIIVTDISSQFDNRTTVFNLLQDQSSINTIVDSRDLEVYINGLRLNPYIKNLTYPWLVTYDSFKGYRVKNNQLIIYNAPQLGQTAILQVRSILSPVHATRKYPFAATTIALGD